VLADRGMNSHHTSVGEQLTALLRAAGENCECVRAADLDAAAPDAQDPPDAHDLGAGESLRARVRQWLGQAQGVPGTVVHLWALDTLPLEQASSASLQAEQRLGADATLSLIQTLVSEAPGTPLWVITRAAQAVSGETALSLSQSPLWGLGRTCAMEHAEVWGGLIDLDPEVAAVESAAQLLEVLRGANGEDQNALRAGQRYVARLIQVQDSANTPKAGTQRQPLTIHSDASYLITGGLWGLGFEVARWLARRGARELLLVGRSALPRKDRWGELEPNSRAARQVAGILELEQLGVSVRYAQLDVADQTAVSAWWQRQQAEGVSPLRGVIHAASVWQDQGGRTLVRPLLGLDSAAMHEVFAPKVNGSFALERVLGQAALDFFVCFSSGASLVGSVAQGNYAAASAFLDALAQHRRLQGRPGLSINWGAVSQAGFGATLEGKRVHEYWEGHGIGRIDPDHVLEALERFIPSSRAQIGVMRNDWGLLARSYPRLASLPLTRYLVARPGNGQSRSTAGGNSALLKEIASAKADQRRIVVAERLREHVAAALRMEAAEVDVEQPLANLGFDSLMAIEIKTRVETDFGVVLPPTRLLESPTIASLAEGTLALLHGLQAQSSAASAASGQRWQEGEL
jgi:NAD(P)-dependent dehydrogenase (short-subunit alcohol dehydrogenase family)/acyl carrier protein